MMRMVITVNLLSILMLLNMLDYLTTIYTCSSYYCLELNEWILRYPVLKFMLPVILPLAINKLLEDKGIAMQGTTRLVILILAIATGIASLHNILLLLLM